MALFSPFRRCWCGSPSSNLLHRYHSLPLCTRGEGGDWCHVKLAVGNLAVGNLAESPGFGVVNLTDTVRKVVMCRALQAWQSLATGATHNAKETHLPHSASDEGPIDLRS